MIITYSPAYALYQRNVRQSQIERAEKKIYDLDDAAIEKEARRWLYIKSDHSNTKVLQSAKNLRRRIPARIHAHSLDGSFT